MQLTHLILLHSEDTWLGECRADDGELYDWLPGEGAVRHSLEQARSLRWPPGVDQAKRTYFFNTVLYLSVVLACCCRQSVIFRHYIPCS